MFSLIQERCRNLFHRVDQVMINLFLILTKTVITHLPQKHMIT